LITIRVLLSGPDRIVGYEVSGHAGFAHAGTDIVCAAVSILAENLIPSLRHLAGTEPEVRQELGFFSVRLDGGSVDERAAILTASALLGFRSIAERFPENVSIESVRMDSGMPS
jgi:hypothetical protein